MKENLLHLNEKFRGLEKIFFQALVRTTIKCARLIYLDTPQTLELEKDVYIEF